jgi:glyoxylase-like metal-dependent hydrolase (beta-lactamase superfamily II)
MEPPPSSVKGPEPFGDDPDGEGSRAELLARHDILLLRAGNPSALTLTGTNTWVIGREPAWVIDPGPRLEDHMRSLSAAIEQRGGLGGVVLTHDHADHSEAVPTLLERFPAALAAARGAVDVELSDGAEVGPFTAISAPGHAPDHFVLLGAGACFSGDAVLGTGSVFISPHPGALSGYLRALDRLRRRGDFDVICPGHGPPVWDPQGKLNEYVAHRTDRENRLIMALKAGRRTVDELLDDVWSDVPAGLRPAAAVTLAAHLDKLEEEHLLPEGVERPQFEGIEW